MAVTIQIGRTPIALLLFRYTVYVPAAMLLETEARSELSMFVVQCIREENKDADSRFQKLRSRDPKAIGGGISWEITTPQFVTISDLGVPRSALLFGEIWRGVSVTYLSSL